MVNPNVFTDGKGHIVEILGMVGIAFSDHKDKYLVDSEILVAGEFDIVIFQNEVWYFDKRDKNIEEAEKEEILKKVNEILMANNIRPRFL